MFDRRDLLKGAGLAAMAAALNSTKALALDTVTLPFANGERPLVKYPQKRPMIGLTSRPPQLETPFSIFNDGAITPNNAFFVRNDVMAAGDLKPSARPYRKPVFRESRNPDGTLSFLDVAEGVKLIRDLPVYDVARDKTIKIADVDLVF